MPPVSRRRTNTRRQASSDIEEGATQTTNRCEDVDDEEQEQPARSRKTVKKVAIQPKQEVDDDDDDDEPIDVEIFPDQPLGESDALKLKGLSNDWSQMIGALMGNVSAIGEVGGALLEHGSKGDVEKYKQEVDSIMKDFLAVQSTMTFHAETLDDIRQKLAQGDAMVDIVSRYDAGVAKREAEHKKKTSRQKYAKDDKYNDFRQTLFEAEHGDDPMPPITELIPKEDGDESDSDSDIEFGGVTQDYKCPLTLTLLNDPVTSKICHHSFSREAIAGLFHNQLRVSKKCPASGCRQSITLEDCVSDKDLARKVKVYQRRQKRKEDQMEVDEVIE